MNYELKETLVSIKDVSFAFGDKQILKPITIEVKDIVRPDVCQGQVIGILGPSGIGKSVFSRILSGLQAPTTGTVSLLLDNQITMVPTSPGLMGLVFQNYRLFAHRTVLGNLSVSLEKSTLSKKEKDDKIIDYLKIFNLEDKRDYYPIQLSGGQRQRIAIIQSLLCSEHYLIMDEPFTGLDPLMKDKVCENINKVANLHEKNTIFVVAHDIGALVSVADTLWLFGRDFDNDGNPIPGAYIKKVYDLIGLGLAWNKDISLTPEYNSFIAEVKNEFRKL